MWKLGSEDSSRVQCSLDLSPEPSRSSTRSGYSNRSVSLMLSLATLALACSLWSALLSGCSALPPANELASPASLQAAQRAPERISKEQQKKPAPPPPIHCPGPAMTYTQWRELQEGFAKELPIPTPYSNPAWRLFMPCGATFSLHFNPQTPSLANMEIDRVFIGIQCKDFLA
jgi:hypothetical protein